MVFIEKILLMTITQHFKKKGRSTFFMPGRSFSSRLTAQFGIPSNKKCELTDFLEFGVNRELTFDTCSF